MRAQSGLNSLHLRAPLGIALAENSIVVYSSVAIERPSSRPQAAYLASPHGRGGNQCAHWLTERGRFCRDCRHFIPFSEQSPSQSKRVPKCPFLTVYCCMTAPGSHDIECILFENPRGGSPGTGCSRTSALIDKLQNNRSSNESRGPYGVTTTTAPCTHCERRLAAYKKQRCQNDTSV